MTWGPKMAMPILGQNDNHGRFWDISIFGIRVRPGVSPDVTPSVPSSPNTFFDSHGVPGAPLTSHRDHRLPLHLSIPIGCDDVTGVHDDLRLQQTSATIIGVCDGRRHLRFWDIMVRHWCPRRFTVIYSTLEQG